MQYFLGYQSFLTDKPFDASLFVDFRKKLGFDKVNEINQKIVSLKTKWESQSKKKDNQSSDHKKNTDIEKPVQETCWRLYAVLAFTEARAGDTLANLH